mgnify:CR=1 FL=1
MALNYTTGDLDEALKVVEDEGYQELSEADRAAIAAQLITASAIRDLSDRLYRIEQAIAAA